MKKKSIVYVDGFNLFFCLLKGHKGRKWFDVQNYFEKLRSDDDIVCIKYFTTLMMGTKKKRQEDYLNALKTQPKIKIILGKFKSQDIVCLIDCGYKGNKVFQTPIEKLTDVNIASHLIADASQCINVKNLIIVSGDSDLVPAIDMVKNLYPEIRIIVYVPYEPKYNSREKVSTDIRQSAHKHRDLPIELILKSQFSDEIITKDGLKIEKPKCW